jgi:hypothetical protein
MVITFSAFVADGYGRDAQAGETAQVQSGVKPEVTLIVSLTRLTVERRNGSISFRVDASASEGFSGTISGTITVPEPSNFSGVELTAGSDSKTFPFRLAAGQKTSDTKPPQTGTFTVSTSSTNPTSGTLIYFVTVDPSNSFTTKNSPLEVKVKTNPL